MKLTVALISVFLLFSHISARSKSEWKSKTIYQVVTDRIWRTNGDTSGCGNLNSYCGGTWKGIQDQLGYIQGMGFDAIWVSPVVKNVPGGGNYHGYSAQNFYKVNPHFGSSQDLKNLINAMHSRGMWIMVDVVANHVGPVDLDFRSIVPFNQPWHYHKKCQIRPQDWNHNQWRVENCRLVNLPDLNQTVPFVRSSLLKWIKNLVNEYNIDGLRIDTVPEVPHDFWSEFAENAGVFQVGECYNGNYGYVSSYQKNLASLFHYPLYFTQNDVYAYGHSAYQIRSALSLTKQYFPDPDVLGLFVDNHDQPRFLNRNPNHNRLKNVLSFVFFARGIPFMYYGTEQGFAGGNIPHNRETLWTNINPQNSLYKFVTLIISIRKKYQIWAKDYTERYVLNNFYVFSRGKVLIATTNNNQKVQINLPYIPYSKGQRVCNVVKQGDCVTINNQGQLPCTLENGEVKIYTPASGAREIWNEMPHLFETQPKDALTELMGNKDEEIM